MLWQVTNKAGGEGIMGGSGGFFSSSSNIENLRSKIDEEKSKIREQTLEIEISKYLNELLVSANDRDIEAINKHIEVIKSALDKDIDGTVDLLYAGSVAKHTYVDGLSDIDSLVILNDSNLTNLTPSQVKDYFYKRLTERFPGRDIKVGKLAVTIKFKDSEIQLLPAVKSNNSVKISDVKGENWALINPTNFTKLLTKVNQEQGKKVIPAIKLAKSIISTLPENRQLSGYHIESLAIETFKNYQGTNTVSNMLRDFFKVASDRVLTPIKDKTGQSIHVDDYLGNERSIHRRLVSDSLARVARKLESASSIEQWKDIFKE